MDEWLELSALKDLLAIVQAVDPAMAEMDDDRFEWAYMTVVEFTDWLEEHRSDLELALDRVEQGLAGVEEAHLLAGALGLMRGRA